MDQKQPVSNQDCEVQADGLGMMKGCAGHVLLTYPSGGNLVASAGHWIELSRLDTSVVMVANIIIIIIIVGVWSAGSRAVSSEL